MGLRSSLWENMRVATHEQRDAPPKAERRFTRNEAKLVAFGTLALLAGIFIGQNTTQVKVHFVFFSAKIRLIWVFLLCILIGALLDRLLTYRGILPSMRRGKTKDGKKPQ